MWWEIILFSILGLTVIFTVSLMYGRHKWQAATKEMRADLEATRLPIESEKYCPDDLIGLPAVVQRYFRTVLKDGQSMISSVSLEHIGTFNMSETGEQWKPFTSTQRVIIQRSGFDWEGRIEMMPGLAVRVHDAYIAGEGILHAAIFGLVSLVNLRGTHDLAQGELMRFFAEAAWYPTALLPSQRVRWEAVNDTTANATLNDNGITVTLQFRFNEKGLIESIRAEARGRTIACAVIPTPWECRLKNYAIKDGLLIPLEGEVAWILPEGPKLYWRGRITKIIYEFAQ